MYKMGISTTVMPTIIFGRVSPTTFGAIIRLNFSSHKVFRIILMLVI